MTTFEQIIRDPHRSIRPGRWASARQSLRKHIAVGLAAGVTLAHRIPNRFTLSQLAGGAAASTGVFMEWGTAVGLLVTGIAVLAAATHLERSVSS